MRVPGWVILLVIVGVVALGLVYGATTMRTETTEPPAAETPPVPAGATDATIEYVHDGDTLFLTDGTKVRLLGIDTPEIGDHLECYGDEATQLLRTTLPEGTHVRVLADVQPYDQYGRSLLFIYTDDGALVNLQMIEAGAAEAVVLPPNVLFSDELEAAEDRAQTAGLGIWGACSP